MTHRNHLSCALAAGLLLAVASGQALAADAPAAPTTDPARAVIRVTLPADAILTIDGDATKSTSADRTFVTPPLETGKDFHYDFKAEFVRGGQTVTVERQVAVRAGRETVVSLNPPAGAAPGDNPARSGSQAYYYAPATPATAPAAPIRPQPRVVPVSPSDDGGVGGARDNWKPDFSDPFLRGPG